MGEDEIENALIRSPLRPAREASAIFRRKAIYEELHPETKAEAFKGNRHTGSLASENSAFTSATSEATGKDRRTVERAAARGEALGDNLGAVTGTSLDKGVELDEISRSFALNPNLDRSCNRRQFALVEFQVAPFLNLTPAPPPFSAMNSTPEISRTASTRAADHVGGALFAFRASRQLFMPRCWIINYGISDQPPIRVLNPSFNAFAQKFLPKFECGLKIVFDGGGDLSVRAFTFHYPRHGIPACCAHAYHGKSPQEIAPARRRVYGLKFQTESPPLLIVFGVQAFERDTRNRGAGRAGLPQPYARPFAIFVDEDHASRFEGGADARCIGRRHSYRAICTFCPSQCGNPDLRLFRQIIRAPPQERPGSSQLRSGDWFPLM